MSLVEKALKKIQHPQGSAERVGGAPQPDSLPLADEAAIRGVLTLGAGLRTDTSHANPSRHSNKTVRIDMAALRAAGLLPPEHQERQIADQYRQIKRPLIANALGRTASTFRNSHLVMIASSLPGEGKTFTSINLALSLALEKDINILLVDADVAKPHVSRIFGVDKQPGLLDALVDESADIESFILPTDVRGLSLLPAGGRVETATEFLSSARMESVVMQLASRNPNQIVLFDSPPLLLTSESRALAHVVGQVVLVVRAGVTPQQAVMDAISYVGDGKSVGLVLNQSEETGPSGAYYGYGTQDGSGTSA